MKQKDKLIRILEMINDYAETGYGGCYLGKRVISIESNEDLYVVTKKLLKELMKEIHETK